MDSKYKIKNLSNNKEIFLPVSIATSFKSRFIGLLFSNPNDSQGLFFPQCSSIHTIGMRMKIDLCFLNNELSVLSLVRGIPPFRFSFNFSSNHVLELPHGSIDRLELQINDFIAFVDFEN